MIHTLIKITKSTITRQTYLYRLFLIFILISHSSAYAWKPEIGEYAEAIDKLEYVDGTSFDLQKLRGKPTVIYFGADWCPHCVTKGRPATEAVAKKYGSLGLQVIFVSMDDNEKRDKKIEESKRIGLTILMPKISLCPPFKCPSGLKHIGDFGQVYTIPSAYLLDADGIVRSKITGGRDLVRGLENAVISVMKLSNNPN